MKTTTRYSGVSAPRLRFGLCCAVALVLGACAATPDTATQSVAANTSGADASQGQPFAATPTDTRIAENLVSIVAQVNDLPPWSSTIQINTPTSSFGSALFDAFEAAGYGVQRVDQDQGNNFISYRSSSEQTESGTLFNYGLWVGGRISVERRFQENQGAMLPATPITLTGIKPKSINVDDRAYSQGAPAGIQFPTGVVFRDDAYELLGSRLTTAVTSGSGATRAAARVQRDARTQEILAPYRPKRQATLSFPTVANNVLGDPNKRAIVEIAEAYNAATDVFLVSGCRPASFSQPSESESDSLERARRIRSELLNRGYASGVILEETCEPGRYNQNLPRRSVVLTLERLRGS